MALSKSELMELAATIEGELVKGESETEIMDTLRIDAETYAEAKRFLFEQRSSAIRSMPNDHVYVDYVIQQRQNIQDLNDLIRNLDKKKQYNALVGAIRLRSDIMDKIVDRGQQFGLIKKVAERREIVGGLIIADMAEGELRKAIAKQLKDMESMMSKFGEKSFLELETGAIHYGEPARLAAPVVDTSGTTLPRGTEGKTAKAKTSKRSAGRRRVRD